MPERKLAPEPTRAISVKRDAEGDSEGSKLVDLHLEAICTAHEGVRNDTLNARAFFIGKLVAAGAASEEEAMQAVLEAAAEAQIDGAAYTAKRSIREGIQAGPYRIPEPSPHFPLVRVLCTFVRKYTLRDEEQQQLFIYHAGVIFFLCNSL